MRIPFGAQSQWSPLDAVQLRKPAQTNRTFLELAASQRFSFPWSSRGFAVLCTQLPERKRERTGAVIQTGPLSQWLRTQRATCSVSTRTARHWLEVITVPGREWLTYVGVLYFNQFAAWHLLAHCSSSFRRIRNYLNACFLLFVCVAWLFIFVKQPPVLRDRHSMT